MLTYEYVKIADFANASAVVDNEPSHLDLHPMLAFLSFSFQHDTVDLKIFFRNAYVFCRLLSWRLSFFYKGK